MTVLTLDGHSGASVAVDMCESCQAFWFDGYESLQLAPGSTLKLFTRIGELSTGTKSAIGPVLHCPRCQSHLLTAHDLQRATPFEYWRCGRGDGRFITFFNFLREKDFIKPLSPQQIAELRQNVRMIHCANCGAPIDLTRDSTCGHCGAALSMLDMKKVATLSATPTAAPTPTRPARLNGADIGALFESEDPSSLSLIDLGLRAVAKWLG